MFNFGWHGLWFRPGQAVQICKQALQYSRVAVCGVAGSAGDAKDRASNARDGTAGTTRCGCRAPFICRHTQKDCGAVVLE